MLRTFSLSADLDGVTEGLVEAIKELTSADHLAVLSTWNGCDKTTWDLPEELEPSGDVNVEWLLRAGQFRLDLRIWGRAIPALFTRAQFARALARRACVPLLFSDCSLFPWSYLEATPDGSILHVVLSPNDDDRLDLLPSVPAGPGDTDFFVPDVLYGPSDPLPDANPSMSERSVPPDYCAVVNGSCPKRLRCDRLKVGAGVA